MNIPSPISVRAPTAAPTPIPAFVPVDRPLSERAVFVGVAVDESAVHVVEAVLTTIEVHVDDAATEDNAGDADVATAGAKFFAIVYRGTVLSCPQQESLSPQHHIVEFAVPSHGVTT